ncbi:MAG: hypothetical protein WD873_02120 [Candidatus Hydrogenedentales bacterium]
MTFFEEAWAEARLDGADEQAQEQAERDLAAARARYADERLQEEREARLNAREPYMYP